MQFFKNLCRAFLRSDPPPAAIFKHVYRNRERVSLSFIDKQRLLRNLSCHIKAIRANSLLLDFQSPLSANLFNQEKCHLYFKLPNEIIKNKLHIKQNPEQNGFLCKSNILSLGIADDAGNVRQVRVKMPQKYIRRELRRHERYNVFSEIASKACLYFLPRDDVEVSGNGGSDTGTAKFFEPHLADISAGGAKVIIEQVDFLDEFAILDSYRLLLKLPLNASLGEKLDAWLACRCVKSNYSINLRRFSLRLEFISPKLPDPLMPSLLANPNFRQNMIN